jgi:phage tail-like protein
MGQGRKVVRHVRSPQWLVGQLPVGLLDQDFSVRFVSMFQELAGTLMENADNVEHLADVSVAPAEMVRWIGSWIGADAVDESLPEYLQRAIVASSARTLTWRGTRLGLQHFLEMLSGYPADVIDGGGVWAAGDAPNDPRWVRMMVRSTGWLEEQDFVALIRDEIPAHVRAELWLGPRQIWSSASGGAIESQGVHR